MSTTPVATLLAVGEAGGHLRVVGDRLQMNFPPDADPGLKAAVRLHKLALIALLKLTFVICRSDVLAATVLFADSEQTKSALVAGGADPGIVYSPDELRELTKSRLSAKDLLAIHAAKKTFSGKIVREP